MKIIYVVRDSWSGDIVSLFEDYDEALAEKERFNTQSKESNTPQYMGNTKFLQSYYMDERKC